MNIEQIAVETHSQPYEIAAFLDLGTNWDDTTELESWQVHLVRAESKRVAEERE